MLYERWRETAREWRSEIALVDLASGRRWSFGELARLTETFAPAPAGLVCPQGHGPEFIFAVLRAWRTQAVLCPLEPEQAPPTAPPPPPIAHLKTTSATTGGPRLVAFTGAQLAADAQNIVTTMGLRPAWANLGVISMAHSYGFSNLVLPLLLHGIPLIIVPPLLPAALRRAARGFAATTLPGVPALWHAWLEADALPANVRLAISAGAPLPAAQEQRVFAATGIKVHNFYGATECGGIAYDRASEPRKDDACVGTPLANVRVSLSADRCLCVRSRAVGQTYWPEPAKTLGNGRFRTSDLAAVQRGAIYLRGRASDLLNVAGRKLSPETVERALRQHPLVRECVVFGLPSAAADRTEVVAAVVAVKRPLPNGALRRFLLDRLPAWQVPREWRCVAAPLSNARGKVSRAEWRERLVRGFSAPLAA